MAKHIHNIEPTKAEEPMVIRGLDIKPSLGHGALRCCGTGRHRLKKNRRMGKRGRGRNILEIRLSGEN